MNPQTILCDELTFIGNTGLDARGFFDKVIIVKTLAPYWDTLRLNYEQLPIKIPYHPPKDHKLKEQRYY